MNSSPDTPLNHTPSRRLHINEDNASFYDYRSHDEMSVAGLHSLVDTYAAGASVRGVVFCANVQRALFDSQVWEPLWHGYDPHGPDDQPMFQFIKPEDRAFVPGKRGRWWVHNLWLLKERGLDHLAIWLDRCRHHRLEGWLSMRMNDCHHNPDPEAFWHSTLWRERPDLHRARHRDEGWFESAFDYAKPEVYAHHMALVRELTERYDTTGLELDWMRWVFHFQPGGEAAGREILNRFMRETRALTDAAAVRLGHPVKLAVRLPTHLQSAWALGYDVFTWAKEKLVDRIVLAPFLEQSCFEFDLPAWRQVLGENVELIAQADASMHAWPDGGHRLAKVHDYKLLFGSAAAALHEGADGIYLFNECYRVNAADTVKDRVPGILDDLLNHAGNADALRDHPRRQAVSYHQVPGPGMAIPCSLPVALTRPDGSFDLGRYREAITLRIPLGPVPEKARLTLRIGLDTSFEQAVQLWINSRPLPTVTPQPAPSDRPLPKATRAILELPVPADHCLPGINILELLAPAAPGHIIWAEMEIL